MRLIAALCLALALAPGLARADIVTVFAAASLKTALDRIAADWGSATGHAVTLAYGGSPQLARQIAEGAPADIFISASVQWMDAVAKDGLIEAASRRDLLGNALVLVAHGAAEPVAIAPGFDLAGLLAGGKLAMALVDAVPAGVYGKAALTSLGVWDSVAADVAQADNVRAALALVAAGEAPYGIVYASDAVAETGVTVVATFPADSHPAIVYPAALVGAGASAAARAFLDHLGGREAAPVFRAQGFAVPGP